MRLTAGNLARNPIQVKVSPGAEWERNELIPQVDAILKDFKFVLAENTATNKHKQKLQREALLRLTILAACRDGYTPEHCLRVGALSALLAFSLGKEIEWCDRIFDAAPLHDIGKACIPDSVLFPQTPLSECQVGVIRDHVEFGHRILAGSGNPVQELAAEIALFHHERWNGRGYPKALAGEDIPISCRIVSVTDFFDSMTSYRSSRVVVSDEEALALMINAKGERFDPRVVEAFENIFISVRHVRELARKYSASLADPTFYAGLLPWWRDAMV